MILALLQDFFNQLVLWEKILAAMVGMLGSLFILQKLFQKTIKNIREANASLTSFLNIIPELKVIASEFGEGSNSLRFVLRRLENNLNHTDQTIRALATSIGVAAFETDKHGLYTFTSKKWAEVTGISSEEALGNGWLNIIDEEERDEIYKEWGACVNQNREFHRNITLFSFPDKRISIVARPIRNLDGTVEKFFGILI